MSQRDLLITGGTVYTPTETIHSGHLRIAGGKIKAIRKGRPGQAPSSLRILDASGRLVLPGFIDIHVNGGGGSITLDGTLDALRSIAGAHVKFGTTAMLPAVMSTDDETLRRAVSAIAEAAEKGTGGANVLGAHLEGPFLNPSRRGIHQKEFLRSPSIEYFDEIYDLARGRLRVIALAPELDNGISLTRHATRRGVVVSLAHSDADYQQTRAAIGSGMKLCDHIFNAMPPLTHRAPGPVGAFLASRDTYVEMIADGFHVHPAVMEMVIKTKGTDRVILATDAMPPAGTAMKKFSISETQFDVKGNSCFAPDGRFAGTALTMNKAVKVILDSTSTSLADALKLASLNPAKLLGIDPTKGSLEVGKDGDVVVADADLNVHATVIGGTIVYQT